MMELVRGFHRGWYRDALAEAVPVAAGVARIPDAPGLGVELAPALRARLDVRRSAR